jgi:hypothetical protein
MRWTLLIILLFWTGAASATPTTVVPDYVATYEANAFGNTLVVVTRLSHEPEGIRMTMDASVVGFLRILGALGFSRGSLFQFEDREVRLLETRMSQKTPRRERAAEARFDWSTNRAHGRVNEVPFEMDVPAGTQDFLSSLYLTMTRLIDAEFDEVLTVDLLERNRLRSYTMENLGKERLNTKLGTLDTTRVARRNGSDVEVSGWFAAELDYLPVRLQYEADGRIYQFEITSFERPAGSAERPSKSGPQDR